MHPRGQRLASRLVMPASVAVLGVGVFLALSLAACSGGDSGSSSLLSFSTGTPASSATSSASDAPSGTVASSAKTPATTPATTYEAPEIKLASFDRDAAEGVDGYYLDLSHTSEGYVGVSATSESHIKFQVITDAITYTYDVDNDGTPSFYPLQSGSGTYRYRIMQNTTGDKYIEAYSTTADADIANDTAPFLYPNFYVSYNADSACVAKAAELASGAADDVAVVAAVYSYVTDHVKYDYDFANNPPAGYCPDPDTTLSTGKGICFDYASLSAAMLRSQGIPCKLITGYVAPNDIYHAWNMIYLKDQGWITVEIKVSSDTWERIDTTFAATGGNNQFVGDGSNYTDRYTY